MRHLRLAVTVLVALALKAVVLAQLHGHPLLQPAGELDAGVYLRLAQRAAAGDWGLGPDVYFVSPLYLYFLAVLLAAGASLLAVKCVQVLLGAAAIGLVFLTGRRLHGERAAWVGAALATLTGVFSFNEVLVLQSALDPFLTALALFLLAEALPAARLAPYAAAGLAFGMLAANRPNALVCAAACVALVALLRRSREGLGQSAALAFGVALVLLPFAVRNRVVAGEWALLTSHGGLNFYIGNRAEADGTYKSVPGVRPSIEGQARDMRAVAERALGRPLTAGQTSGYFFDKGVEWMRSRPGDALALFLRKLAYVLNELDLSLNYSYAYYSRDERTLLRFLLVGPWLLVPLGLVGLVAARPCGGASYWAWAAFVPAYAVSVAAFFVSSRYRMPLLVPLCVSSGAAVAEMARAARAGERGRLAALAAAAGALAPLAVWRPALDDGRANERAEMVLHLVDSGRDAEARELLARTEATHPEKALLYYRVARAYQERSLPAEAVPLLEKARVLEGARLDIRLALGRALLDAGRPAEAVPHLRAAREGITAPGVGFDLARALAASGEGGGALEVLGEVRLPPGADAADHLTLGQLALELGDGALAEKALRRAVARSPALAAAHERLGLALSAQGRAKEAVAELEEACRLDAGSASARLNLAVLHAQQGRLAEARARAEEALRLQPDYAQARGLLEALSQGR